ncbi:uncharacterized protein ColSpa_11939 [Colletotrichum spaethianum]|uniref:Uncharacterized protein n=1 Tax=Colletotrichum spaethianum TaxID=700344 RepID=A0AA37PG92_9PEZI|nr:uncharacterized protein ColSpa_11939 [Colletotrichum spaethianum]GKT51758.1 hypothetical protein ColSpa_11939 [Colletotrichum spaethianum]
MSMDDMSMVMGMVMGTGIVAWARIIYRVWKVMDGDLSSHVWPALRWHITKSKRITRYLGLRRSS